MSTIPQLAIAAIVPVGRRPQIIGRRIAAVLVAMLAAAGMAAAEENARSTAPAAAETALAPPEAAAVATAVTHGQGGVFCNGVRTQDEIVIVNVRQLGGCCDPEKLREGIVVENYAICSDAGTRRWQPSDLSSFLAFDPGVPTLIFVHGNQISPGDAKCEGLAVYRRVMLHGCDAPPIRFVIFSWPASKIHGLLRDVRVKAARTGPAGFQLAWLIDQMPAETPLSLAGFSFGARIITGGLHILAGGSLGGRMCLSEHVHPQRPPMSVFMMASALHAHWLGDGQYHGLAMTQVRRMGLINNCKDPAMVYYDFIEPGHGGPQALGLCGPTCLSRETAQRIFNRDVSRYVGSEHDLMRYICAPGDAGLFWDYTLGASVSAVGAGN